MPMSHDSVALSDPSRIVDPAILFVEDDPRLGSMTRDLLSHSYRITWVKTGEEAIKNLDEKKYDALIVDRRLPDIDGLTIVRILRSDGRDVPVLMLTALSAVDDVVDGLDAGANDYLAKPFHFAELEARLRSLMRGAVRREEVFFGSWTLFPKRQQMENTQGECADLTAAETRLMELLGRSPHHVFSQEELTKKVFSNDSDIGVVVTYVSYIRQKTTHDVIVTVRGKGYCAGSPLPE